MDAIVSKFEDIDPKPILKWAGGKTQLLEKLLPLIPQGYGCYHEPFLGGGALFFAAKPVRAQISDSNPELVNLYEQVAEDSQRVFRWLTSWKFSEDTFYRLRSLDWKTMVPAEAAARTIFLNKTCFNGLFRVNKSGAFNVPWGHYKKQPEFKHSQLRAAGDLLRTASIKCCDYLTSLESVEKGDFVFLDPPYVPLSKNADFKRYTKEQFSIEDHKQLSIKASELVERGAFVVLTNSNHELVNQLYSGFESISVPTKRYISCIGNTRSGIDLILVGKQRPEAARTQTFKAEDLRSVPHGSELFPPTRYMGSKSKLLPEIWKAASKFKFDSFVDLFSGTGIVGYMFKRAGKSVLSNDYLHMAYQASVACIENDKVVLDSHDLNFLFSSERKIDSFVRDTFGGLYFDPADELTIDKIRTNIKRFRNPYKKAIAISALVRSCIKKRPRGIFTYTGSRYQDGRRDLQISLEEHFLEAVSLLNDAVFSNGQRNFSTCGDFLDLRLTGNSLIYIDPPYFSPLSDNEYVRRYHFVEGLARDWEGVEIQTSTKTKKFRSYSTPFNTLKGTIDALSAIFEKSKRNPVMLSYSSNALPDSDELLRILRSYKKNVELIPVDYRYSFANQGNTKNEVRNTVKEFLFLGW